jgi:hypothetical protein
MVDKCGVSADTSGSDEEVHRLFLITTAALGFATYKVALVAASLAPENAAPLHSQSIE